MTPVNPTDRSPFVSAVLTCIVLAALLFEAPPAYAQGRDRLVNGALIGAAVGAGAGIAFTHAVRDSDLTASQYARGALIFGALGAGVGLGLDALLNRTSPLPRASPPRVVFMPVVSRNIGGAIVKCRW
jgi:hypothetical protein